MPATGLLGGRPFSRSCPIEHQEYDTTIPMTTSTKFLFCQAWLSSKRCSPVALQDTYHHHPVSAMLPERGMLCQPPKSLQSPQGSPKCLVLKPTRIIMLLTCSSSWNCSCCTSRHQGSSSLEKGAQHPLPKHLL